MPHYLCPFCNTNTKGAEEEYYQEVDVYDDNNEWCGITKEYYTVILCRECGGIIHSQLREESHQDRNHLVVPIR